MALTVDTNSYIGTTDADTYFADRLNSDLWTGDDKDKALIQATQIIDNSNYLGSKISTTQALKFPRYDLYDDGIALASDETPQRVLDATCELAIYLLQEDYSAPNDMADYGRVKIGALEVETSGGGGTGVKTLPPLVNDLLKPFIISGTRLVRG